MVSDLDETDKIRLMIEVERELADLDREKKLRQQQLANTKTTLGAGGEYSGEDIFQVQDKDLIGTDERGTSTQDLELYLRDKYGLRPRAKEVQTEQANKQMIDAALDCIDMYDMGLMRDKEINASGNNN